MLLLLLGGFYVVIGLPVFGGCSRNMKGEQDVTYSLEVDLVVVDNENGLDPCLDLEAVPIAQE